MQYFAYGNLLDIDVMRRVCPSARAVGVMRLDDYEIGFAKCADPTQAGCTLDKAPGASMWGVQYELSDEDMARLDKAAGVGKRDWVHHNITVRDRSGAAVETMTYIIPETSGPHQPPDSYVAPIYKGAADFDLPADYVARLRALIEQAQSKTAA